MLKINDIVEYNKSGLTFDEISKKLNYSVVYIKKILKKNNIKLKNNIKFKIYVNINRDELEKMYKDNVTIKDISEHFNCSINTIRLRLNEYGIKLNTDKVYFKPIKGQKFDRLKFIKEDIPKYGKKYWICECDCGKIKYYDYYNIIKGYVKSCGCYHKENVKNYNWTGYNNISGTYWGALVSGAKRRNIEFNISLEYAWNIYEKQNKKCKLSNLPIEFETKNKKIEHFNASLDRIDSSKGYIEGNVQWIVKEINYMKNKLNENKFIYLCKKIALYNE